MPCGRAWGRGTCRASPCRKHRHHRSPRVLAVPGGGTSPRGCAPLWPRAGPVPAAWSNHGRHHRSLCREGSAGLLGAVEWQMGGLRTATLSAPTPSTGGRAGRAGRGVHHDAPWGSTRTGVGDGSRSPCCAQRGGGGTEGRTPQLSPGLASSCPSPVPRGSRSWWYFSCLARIRSILPGRSCCGAHSPKPPWEHPHPPHPHRGAPRCSSAGAGRRVVPGAPPKPTHCRFS